MCVVCESMRVLQYSCSPVPGGITSSHGTRRRGPRFRRRHPATAGQRRIDQRLSSTPDRGSARCRRWDDRDGSFSKGRLRHRKRSWDLLLPKSLSRPKRSVGTRLGSDCNLMVTGHRPGKVVERQLFGLPIGWSATFSAIPIN